MTQTDYYVYIMTNNERNVLYTGVTNDLVLRVYEHRQMLTDDFTKKHKLDKLVYFEVFFDLQSAIAREKQIKAGTMQAKVQLLESVNPLWRDLWEEISAIG